MMMKRRTKRSDTQLLRGSEEIEGYYTSGPKGTTEDFLGQN